MHVYELNSQTCQFVLTTVSFVCFDHVQKYDPDFDATDNSNKSYATGTAAIKKL
jgi:hypothetical protein